jgi:hypothetical protein
MADRTKKALLYMHLFNEPLVVIYALLPFILRKDLGASLFQISILAALKPTIPIFSFYWSANRRLPLKINLMGAWMIGRLPFLFIPFIDSIWYLILACAIYELFSKSGIPSVIEILKKNISKGEREYILTLCMMLTFLESILIGLLFAGFLDQSPHAWRWICGITVILSLSSLFAQWQIPSPDAASDSIPPKKPIFEKITSPWKETFSLLKEKPDFARFQIGFMMGGFGLMLIAPSLAIFYANTLDLSHANVVTGRSILMGFGILLSSYFWKEAIKNHSIFKMTLWILLGFGLYPILLLLAKVHLAWFYFSLLLYGIAQAGSHLLWNLSGTIFSQDTDSSPYSRVNIFMLGLRGAIAPTIGGYLCYLYGPSLNLMIGSFCCLSGALYMTLTSKLKNQRSSDKYSLSS